MAVSLEVDGAGALVAALAKFNKEIYKTLQSEVKQAAGHVASYAQQLTPDLVFGGGRSTNSERPSKGWGPWSSGGRDLGYSETRVDRSIKTGVRQRRVRGAGVVGIVGRVTSSDPALSIYATAGSQTPNSLFNRNITYKWGAMPTLNGGRVSRVLGQALIVKGPEAAVEIDRALERARARFGLS